MGQKLGAMSLSGEGWKAAWPPFNTTWHGPRPTSVPCGIVIHPTVWPQYKLPFRVFNFAHVKNFAQ